MDTPTLLIHYQHTKNINQLFADGERIIKKSIMIFDICNKAQAIYYQKNKERISKYKKEYYLRKKAEKLAIDGF